MKHIIVGLEKCNSYIDITQALLSKFGVHEKAKSMGRPRLFIGASGSLFHRTHQPPNPQEH